MVERIETVAFPPHHAGQSRRSRSRWLVILGTGILAAGAGFAYWFTRHGGRSAHANEVGRSERVSSDGASAGAVTRVEVVHPWTEGLARTTTQPGSVQAFYFANLYAQISGYLKKQDVDIGDSVKEDQLLAKIDAPAYEKEVKVSEAAVKQAEAKVEVARSKISTAEANHEAATTKVKQAEADVEKSQSAIRYRKSQLDRIKALVRRGDVEQKLQDEELDRYDAAVSELHANEAAVLADQAEVAAAKARIAEAEADLDESKADLDRAKADLDRAKVFVGFTEIRSPYNGVVTLRSFNRGDFINTSSEGSGVPILSVAIIDKVRVVLKVPDRDVPFVDRGDPAIVRIDALPGRDFHGKVARFADREDPSDRTMRTEIDLDNPDGILRDGMYGGVTIILAPAPKDRASIPTRCLHDVSEDGTGAVFIVRDRKARRISVSVGRDNGQEVEITKGLSPDDQVVYRYNGALADGSPVESELIRMDRSSVVGG